MMCETPVDHVDQLWETGQWERIIPIAQADVASAHQSQDPVLEADSFQCLVFLYGQVGRKPEAVQAAHAEVRLRRCLGLSSDYAFSLAALAFALECNRRGQAALRVSRLALAIYRRLEDWSGIRDQSVQLARMLHAQGRCEESLAILDEALSFAQDRAPAPSHARILMALAQAHKELWNPSEAMRYLSESARVLKDDGESPVEALLGLAVLHREVGEIWQAREVLGLALEHLQQRGETGEAQAIIEQIRALKPKKGDGVSMCTRFAPKGTSRRLDC